MKTRKSVEPLQALENFCKIFRKFSIYKTDKGKQKVF